MTDIIVKHYMVLSFHRITCIILKYYVIIKKANKFFIMIDKLNDFQYNEDHVVK